MDLQIRKIHFIQEFLRLNNETAVGKLETVLKTEKKKIYSKEPEPMTLKEFNAMIDKAEDDSKNKRYKNVHDLKKEVKTWR
jgi:hypothetical protein